MTVTKLLNRLYGLRQSPSNWWGTIYKPLAEIGFQSLKLDLCVYIYSDDNKFVIFIL